MSFKVPNYPTINNEQFQSHAGEGIYLVEDDLLFKNEKCLAHAGDIIFVKNGVIGRENKPSKLCVHGEVVEFTYYLNDKVHKLDGPAFIFCRQSEVILYDDLSYLELCMPLIQEWHFEGQIHNPDGAAYVARNHPWENNHRIQYWIHNFEIPESEFYNHPKRLKALEEKRVLASISEFKKKIESI